MGGKGTHSGAEKMFPSKNEDIKPLLDRIDENLSTHAGDVALQLDRIEKMLKDVVKDLEIFE